MLVRFPYRNEIGSYTTLRRKEIFPESVRHR
jgi:hypothetical protein